MARIVDDLLLLARLEEGFRLQLQPTEVDLVLSEAALRAAVVQREPLLDVEPGVVALADPERLLQVVTNLVMNAVQHAGPDATIRLAGTVTGNRVRITVTDDGIGITPDELEAIFDRHRRGNAAQRSGTPGAGLGLAIASSLTTAMGGEIEATSAVGRGTTFTVLLPAAAPDRG